MGRAILVGYFGEHNTGDDAFLTVSAWGVREFCGHRELYATTRKSAQHSGERIRSIYPLAIRGSSRFYEFAYARAANSIIFAGGSVFHTESIIRRYLTMVRQARPGPHLAVGVSVGPFRDQAAESACKELLTALSFVGVRDQVSLERVRALAPDVRSELTFDLAPLLPVARNLPPCSDTRPRRGLGIALCNNDTLSEQEIHRPGGLVETVARAVRRSAGAGVVDRVVLIDFNAHPRYSDTPLHRALAERLGSSVPVEHIPYAEDPCRTWDAVAGMQSMIAMRLHAAVFSYGTRTPTLILAYHEKCREWAGMVGVPSHLVLDVATLEEDELSRAIERMQGEAPLASLPVEEAVQRAMRNWQQ
ncbi:MAG: polysaccharide pyruvyl transferase family protein [Armatimonadota bacterium]